MKLIKDRLMGLVENYPKGFTYCPTRDIVLLSDTFSSEELYLYSLDLERNNIRWSYNWLHKYPIDAILYSYFDDNVYPELTYIGYWRHNDKDYWDLTRVAYTLEQAMEKAIYNNQEYIYDLINQKDIKVKQ